MRLMPFLLMSLLLAGCKTAPKGPTPEEIAKKAKEDLKFQTRQASCQRELEAQSKNTPERCQSLDVKPAKYPQNALNNGVQGCAVLIFDVDREGRLSNFRTALELPAEYGFAGAAAESLAGSTFEPKAKKRCAYKMDFQTVAK